MRRKANPRAALRLPAAALTIIVAAVSIGWTPPSAPQFNGELWFDLFYLRAFAPTEQNAGSVGERADRSVEKPPLPSFQPPLVELAPIDPDPPAPGLPSFERHLEPILPAEFSPPDYRPAPPDTGDPTGERAPNADEIFERYGVPRDDETEPFLSDTTDTSLASDTTIVDSTIYHDSTARVKHFKHKRSSKPYISLYEREQSSFYAKPTKQTRVVEIDSTGEFVEVREKIGDTETKVALRMPLDVYLDQQLDARQRRMWDDIAYDYELQDDKVGLEDLISDVTELKIPLPKVGVLTIFGKPEINLRINGAVDIHAAWRNETTEGMTVSRLGNTRNEPDFKQQVQINVNGTIGDKLEINADWNTERTFEYENQLKIAYTGYEDEIVQSVEAGNVSLSLPSLIGGSEALFGVKAKLQFGPLFLTTLVSQKKGEVKEKSVSGGVQTQEFEIHAYDYSKSHYFVDEVYTDTSESLNLFQKYFGYYLLGLTSPNYDPNYEIVDIEVWKSVNQILTDKSKEREAIAHIDLESHTDPNFKYGADVRDADQVSGEVESGRFMLLEQGVDYEFEPRVGLISFRSQINDNEIIAVAYRVGSTGDSRYYGEMLANSGAADDTTGKLVLKLVKPQNLGPAYEKAWKLQAKNFYFLGSSNIKRDGFELDIQYVVDGGEPQSVFRGANLLNVFGLDRMNESGNETPGGDGKFDWKSGSTILPVTGEIVFPVLQPFGAQMPPEIADTSTRYQDIYDKTVAEAKRNTEKDKFLIKGVVSGEASSKYMLGFNIVENSVKVLLDGNELSEGADYSMDYTMGQLTIYNSAALAPGANLRISYEENDLVQLASKTLYGARGEIELAEKTSFGFSAMTVTHKTLSDKVRLGEEPLSNSIYGVDFGTEIDLPFLTNAVDYLFPTKQTSLFSLSGEAAYIDPDPNTQKSEIASDNGQSIAYVDDFEGSKRVIPFGISFASWKFASPPSDLPAEGAIDPADDRDETAAVHDFKAKSYWYGADPSGVTVRDIWPKKSFVPGDDQVRVLDFVFLPQTPGVYNVTPRLSDPTLAWGGMMKPLSSTASNLIEENIEFIELWVKVVEAPEGASFTLDLGLIPEDVIPNGRLDTEDLNENYLIDEGEDRGLDGLTDSEERAAYDSDEPDPAFDNFPVGQDFRSIGYQDINNPEGNAASQEYGRFPDTEDLNNNGTLDLNESYFRYELPLDTAAENNPFIAGGGNNDGWFLYRVPLKDYASKNGNASFENVKMARLFVTGVDDRVHLRLTEFNLVGNQWRKPDIEDTIINVTVVGVEDNPEYVQPPGVKRERDRSQTEHEIYKNEQSLALQVNGLPYGEKREIVKTPYKPLDLFNYSELKLFVHGDEYDAPGTVSYYVDENSYAAEVYFRFGTDTNHYYEYRQPVRAGWNEIGIIFDDLTALKQARDSAEIVYRVPVPDKPGHSFAVKGNPSLTSIKTMAIGIENVYNPYSREGVGAPSPYSGEPISGEVWVNELRVIGADDTPGWSYRGASSLKIADVLTLSSNYSRTDPYFHRVAERFGSRQDQQSWNASANLNVMKLVPFKAKGSSLNVNYSHSENIRDPLYLPGTDVQVEEAKRLYAERLVENGYTPTQARELAEDLESSSQTLSTTDTWSVSNIRLLAPTDHWLAEYTWNALTYNFSYNKGFQRDPTTISSKNWSWDASADYGISFSDQFNVEPPEWPLFNTIFAFLPEYQKYTISLLPQSFNAKMSAKRNRQERVTRPTAASESNTTVSRDFTAARGFSYNWKITQGGLLNISNRYSMDINSSLAHLLLDDQEMERENGEIFEDIFADEWFGRDQNYRQTFDVTTAPQLPTFFDLNRYFTVNAGYNVNYDWQFNFSQEELGRSARFANSSKVGMKVRVKALLGPLFEEDTESSPSPAPDVQPPRDRRRDFDRERESEDDTPADTTAPADTTEPAKREIVPSSNPLTGAFKLFKGVTEYFLVNYENVGVDYTNRVSFGGGGLAGESHGFGNFWGFSHDPQEGPSRLFMLGLDSDLGPRAAGEAGAQLTDQFSEDNSLTFTTSRQLWEGATINLNWKLNWGLQKQTTYIVQPDVDPEVTNITSTGKLTRSFVTMPPAFFLSVFKSGITSVAEEYNPDAENPAESLSNAFVSGFETLPWLSDFGLFADVAKYIPRANWSFTWTGLEKFPLFQGFAQRVTLDHAYTSDYTEAWKFDPDGNKVYTSQKISYGFSPLFGLNMTFKNLWDGNFTGSFKYSTRTNYDLTRAKQSITEALNQEIGFSLSYSKSGFEAPLFGVALKNDIEFSLAYSISSNSSVRFDMNDFNEEGTPQDGTATTTIEPRIKYVLSSRVTLSIFYKRVDIEPEGSSTIQPSSRNEAGVDVRISIQ